MKSILCLAAIGLVLAGCAKSPEPAAQNHAAKQAPTPSGADQNAAADAAAFDPASPGVRLFDTGAAAA
jgi:hypothetical protein